MYFTTIMWAIIVLGALAIVFGLILAVAALESKHKEKFMLCLPTLLMTLGLLTTHTNGAVRYAIPVLYCVPMLLLLFRVTEKNQ